MVKAFLAKPGKESMELAQSAIDKATKNGVLHRNKASRMKSQLAKKIENKDIPAKVVAKKVAKKPTKRTVKDKMSK